MDTLTDKEMRREIKRLKERLSGRYDIERALLFGSRARGDNLLDSDVDLLLVSKDFGPNFHERIRDVAREWEHVIPLEPICYTPKELKDMVDRRGIVRQALEEGILV
jgi:hypothetical protein